LGGGGINVTLTYCRELLLKNKHISVLAKVN
jgi:hypothetical protein